MTLSIIVAITKDFGIGKDNDLLLHIPGDLKHFKNTTKGHTIVMGRRTLESLPNGALPYRRNIVLSTDKNYTVDKCEVAHSIDEVRELCKDDDEVFIIGGGAIYQQFYPIADKLYLTIAETSVEADTHFPDIDFDQWTELSREDIAKGEKCDFAYSFINYERKK